MIYHIIIITFRLRVIILITFHTFIKSFNKINDKFVRPRTFFFASGIAHYKYFSLTFRVLNLPELRIDGTGGQEEKLKNDEAKLIGATPRAPQDSKQRGIKIKMAVGRKRYALSLMK